MQIRKNLLSLLFLQVLLTVISCHDNNWKTSPGGLVYKIFPSGYHDSVGRPGFTVKLHYQQRTGDSIIHSTYGVMPLYIKILPTSDQVNDFPAVLAGLKKGDSVVIRQKMDSVIANDLLPQLPVNSLHEDQYTITLKVLEIFSTDSASKADEQKESKRLRTALLELGNSRLYYYLNQENIGAAEINKGIYIQPIKNGSGGKPASGKRIRMDCRIVTLEGRSVERVMDTSLVQNGVLDFTLGTGFFPEAVENTILYFNKGSHARIYMAGTLVFGHTPLENLQLTDDFIFDIRILEVE